MYRTMENVRRLQHCSLRDLFSQSAQGAFKKILCAKYQNEIIAVR